MNRKHYILLTVTAVVLLLAGLLFFFREDLNLFTKNNSEIVEDTSANYPSENSSVNNEFVFVGDKGFLVKGKLLKPEFEKAYKQLPDTLYQLQFNDHLYLINHLDGGKKNYSLVDDATKINEYQGTWEQEKLIAYLQLASKGAVDFPSFTSPQHIDYNLYTTDDFRTKYKDYFIETVDNYGMSDLPYDVKDKIIEFYESKEGENYRYKIKGKQTTSDLMWRGELTGKNKDEVALLLNNTESNLDDKYILLVYACKSNPDDSFKEYYLVYNETFYNRVLLDRLKISGDGEEYVRQIYMNSNDLKTTEFDGIVLKQFNAEDEVLVYSKEYDKLFKYRQVPLSKQNENEEDEYY